MAKTNDRRNKIEKSLMRQLIAIGANVDHYADLISDYMGLWDIKTKLLEDIDERGVTFVDRSSTGVPMMKNNPSTKELVMVNKQMLSLLKELGLSTETAGAGDPDEL